jgi:hypothetical protein
MKTFFLNKTWLVMQGVFFTFGMFSGFVLKTAPNVGEVGAIAVALHFLSSTTELTIPLFSILISDLVLNTEILEGTFVTHLLSGKKVSTWIIERMMAFTLFIAIQFLLAGLSLSLGTGIVTKHWGLEGLKMISKTLPRSVIIGTMAGITMNFLKTLTFVSMAVFITTLFPGRLFIGAGTSIGMLFMVYEIGERLARTNRVVFETGKLLAMENLQSSWWTSTMMILTFWLLSYFRIKKIKFTNQGV